MRILRICSDFFAIFLLLTLSCHPPSTALHLESYPTANLSTTWPKNHSYNRPVLVSQTNVATYFACGFTCGETCTSRFFSIFIIGSVDEHSGEYQILWSANRDYPVGDNAILNFTAAGELVLMDGDGSIVWTTNTEGKSVAGMNLTDTGNLVLFDDQNSIVWQSFDHPTDSLLPGQKLFTGQQLKSSVSLTNISGRGGMYSLQVTDNGVFAYVESNPPQAYLRMFDNHFGNDTKKGRSYIRFLNGSLSFFIDSYKPSDHSGNDVIDIPEASSAQYMKLLPDGRLQLFEWRLKEWVVVADITLLMNQQCSYPLVCGRNAVCSTNQQCSCPKTEYFGAVDGRQPNLGCSEINPLTCNSTQDQHLITLHNVTYFTVLTSAADMEEVNTETCKQALSKQLLMQSSFF